MMIRNIELTNFKCFEEVSFRTRLLTIIAGGNAMGKSSIIQSLLLLAQSRQDMSGDGRLRLCDQLVNLVSSDQMLYSGSQTPEVRIAVDDDSLNEDFEVNVADASESMKQPECETSDNADEAFAKMALFSKDFVYLHANRLSPQSEYLKGNNEQFDSRLGNRSGHRTVFRLQEALDNNEDVAVATLRRDGKEKVGANVNSWLSYIMGSSVVVSADGNPSEGKAELFYSTPAMDKVAALNMAFGNTYILPVILGLLTAPVGSLFIVENPEAHLHPRAQFRMGEMLALAAQGGVQIFVETHSDHLLNGVRVAAKKGMIDPMDVAIHFIEEEDGEHITTEIELSDDGTLDKWPSGFFDEWERALQAIVSTGDKA